MTLTIELTPQQEAQLAAEARREGLDSAGLARQLVLQRLSHVGQDQALLAEWERADAEATADEREADDRIWEAFEKGINQTREALGMRQL